MFKSIIWFLFEFNHPEKQLRKTLREFELRNEGTKARKKALMELHKFEKPIYKVTIKE